MNYPTADDCKPGLWVQLASGWIVGPIVETEFTPSVYVAFGGAKWAVDVSGDDAVKSANPKSPRFVVRVGTRGELLRV